MWCNSWMVRLTAAAGCAAALNCVALADDDVPRSEVRQRLIRPGGQVARMILVQQADEDRQPRASSHWLGIECFPLNGALRSQLGLAENAGLIIEQVVPDSPAAKAELKQYDVIVKAGDVEVASLADLMKAVDDAQDKELALEIIRGGKPMTVKAMPAARPESQDVLRRIPTGAPDALRTWIEQFNRGEPGGPIRYRVFGPGAVLPGADRKLPKGMSVSITRNGDEPAKITVKKGDQMWEVSEKELDKLPDDVRPHVERMLGRGVLALPGAPEGMSGPAPPAIAPPFRPEMRRFEGGAEKQLQEMMEQLDRLRKQMDELQKNLPKQPHPPAKDSRA